jgi:8-oxo-dGTP pyrophosphatase MutT (NUDIX family)
MPAAAFFCLYCRADQTPSLGIPEGRVDEGETLLQTALRELREETGLFPEHVSVVPGFEWSETYRFTSGREEERTLIHKQVTYYLAESSTREVQLSLSEISEFAWLELEEATRRIKYPERRRMLREAAVAAGCA